MSLTDDTLDALTHGELSDDELGFLRALADGDPEAEGELEAALPLDDDARGRIADSLVAMTAIDAEATDPHGNGPWPRAVAPAPRRSSGRRPWVMGGAVVALAAAVALVVVPSLEAPQLPPYELEVRGQQSASRSAPAEVSADTPLRLAPEGTLELVLRPSESARAEGALFLEQGDRLVPFALSPDRAPNGTLRWQVPAARLGESATVVVAHDRERPTAERARRLLAEGDRRASRVRVRVELATP